jgi:low affinity Fe/Cu permease
MRSQFSHFASRASEIAGHYWTFIMAGLIVLVWAISGPFLGFSETWQLAINTVTTITTFLMVFLIQQMQNRESRATQLKLDELLDALELASDTMINIEESTDEELDRLTTLYRRRGEIARATEPELQRRDQDHREGRTDHTASRAGYGRSPRMDYGELTMGNWRFDLHHKHE